MLTTIIDLAEDRRSQLLEDARQGHLARGEAGARRRRWRSTNRAEAAGSLRPVMVAAVGLVLVGLSAGTLLLGLWQGEAPQAAHHPAAVPSSELAEVTTADLVYEPGHSSGWHVHPGLHAVVVLSGTLSVYDHACVRHDYGPGQTYLGGRQPHVARNEQHEPIRLVATYVADELADRPGSPVGAPAGCEAVA